MCLNGGDLRTMFYPERTEVEEDVTHSSDPYTPMIDTMILYGRCLFKGYYYINPSNTDKLNLLKDFTLNSFLSISFLLTCFIYTRRFTKITEKTPFEPLMHSGLTFRVIPKNLDQFSIFDSSSLVTSKESKSVSIINDGILRLISIRRSRLKEVI